MDGSYIASAPSLEDRSNSRNRKGFVAQNVLACCGFDMKFRYLLCGWDGSVTDTFLYHDARTHDFPIPEGRFWLGDAGFGLCDGVLTPYQNIRYHLAEWQRAREAGLA